MEIGYVYDPIYLKHDTGQHVENAKRLEAIISNLEQTGLRQQLTLVKPRAASVEELSLVHLREYISRIQDVAQRGGGWLDTDTVTSTDSYEVALYAAGGVISAAEAVMDGEVASAFALVRPPGHHATSRRAMGFCLFNNIAIATQYALARYKLERILIVDFDVHHGNGTQEAFYDIPQVMYISTHEYPFYPGTGSVEEIGSGEAKGATINVPLPAGCGDSEYLQVFKQVIVPVAKRFQPQLILVSAGYDSHWADGIALMQVSVTGFAHMVRIFKGLADELCNGRLVFSLEGGYNLTALATSVKATFDMLLGNTSIDDPLGQSPRNFGAPRIDGLIKAIKEIHALP
ncbi:MAG: histone deacetylase [Dehalococcoidia bacterium]|nr:histone deacetylase [Dehalococcoidia bacterium]